MPYDYIKVKRSVLTGSLHREDPHTKWLFLAMIFESTEGILVATIDHLCRISGLTHAEVAKGLEALQRPDADSTSPEQEGRRIMPETGARNTYRIVNFEKYQPSLVKRMKNKQGEVIDPTTGQSIPRSTSDGKRNPAYDRIRKRSERAARQGTASEQESDDDDRPELVHCVHSVHERKGNKRKEKEYNPPISPSQSMSNMDSQKAIRKGKPENAESWERFCSVYPRRLNGATLQRAEARQIWDLLAEEGENMERIVQAAEKYQNWINDLDKSRFVCMMTTWLNKRLWEESFDIDPNSEEGKRIAAKENAVLKERRSAHQKAHAPNFEAYIDSLAEIAISDPEFEEAWRREAIETIERRKQFGSTVAIELAERMLGDPKKAKSAMIRCWKETQENDLCDFWEWDRDHNPNRFE